MSYLINNYVSHMNKYSVLHFLCELSTDAKMK